MDDSLSWKDWRRICPWCNREVKIVQWNEEPEIDWFGKSFKSVGIYWHGPCIQEKLNWENSRNEQNSG